jgi:hypothetical protein
MNWNISSWKRLNVSCWKKTNSQLKIYKIACKKDRIYIPFVLLKKKQYSHSLRLQRVDRSELSDNLNSQCSPFFLTLTLLVALHWFFNWTIERATTTRQQKFWQIKTILNLTILPLSLSLILVQSLFWPTFSLKLCHYYRVFHRFWQVKFVNGGLILRSSQFLLLSKYNAWYETSRKWLKHDHFVTLI